MMGSADNLSSHDLAKLSALDLSEVVTPAFLVDIDIARNNARTMRERCQKIGVNLRPHMKTHKTLQFAEMMTGGTKRCVVVSTLAEAEFYANGGYDDILYALPFAKDKIPRMRALAERLTAFHVLLDSDPALTSLLDTPLTNGKKWSVYLKVDCGYHRAGVRWDSEDAVTLAKGLHGCERVSFQGIYTHDGDSYGARGEEQLKETGNSSADKLINFSARLEKEGIPCPVVATGSTPSCSKPGATMSHLTEFHPGNYIFYDAQQCVIGSCSFADVAGIVATRVIGHYPHRNQLLVDCGWTALSLDGKGALPGGSFCFISGEPNLSLIKMTQEAGTIGAIEGNIDFEKFPIGRVLFFIPYHACATACMHPNYLIHSGGKIIDKFEPCRGW